MYIIVELSEIFLIPPNEETHGLIPPVPTAIRARPIRENSLNIKTVDKDDIRNRQCGADFFLNEFFSSLGQRASYIGFSETYQETQIFFTINRY